jgi:VanZ family protein
MAFPSQERTRLPHALAALYALAIVYASLTPFGPWLAPRDNVPFFLLAPWPARVTRYDVVQNLVGYVPFGFFLAFAPRVATPLTRIATALVIGAALSCAMETMQMSLPSRDASIVDFTANSIGAMIGGICGAILARAQHARRRISQVRQTVFLRGTLGDVGVALIVVWLAAQINPGIALFAVTFDPEPARYLAATATSPDLAALAIEAAESAFQLLGVGLFTALLVRERRFAGGAVLLLIGIALLVKGVAATLLLKPAMWETWLRPGVLIGIAAGALMLLVAIGLPRPVQVAFCGVALLSSIGAPLLAPDLLSAHAPLSVFNWRYGHLLQYNGLTRAVLLAWPVAAAVWLFALAGRPAWGKE